MNNKYKYYVYTLVVSMLIPVEAQSIQDLERMKTEYQKIQREQAQEDISMKPLGTIDSEARLPRQVEITPYIVPFSKKDKKPLKYFGHDFFTQRDTIPFWENLPTPRSYLLGPGDELVISLWGETQLRETYTINREGKIYDAKVGLMNLTGKNIQDAISYLKDQFGRIYATLKGPNPSTFIDVSLGELRSINVNFVGQVNYPGVYPVHPFSTVITGLIQAGGVDTTGSLRNIQINRDGKLFSTTDLYAYFLKGESPEDIQLRDQDIVFVPVKNSIITIDSAVMKPAKYEGITGETVYDLIQYAGGLTQDASATVSLQRIKPVKERTENNIYENFYLELESTKLIETQNGDHISIRKLFQKQKFVQLIGQVKVPGNYNFYEGMRLTDLLRLGGGLADSTYIKSIYLKKAEIIRRNPNSRYEELININLGDIIKSPKDTDIALQNLDRIVIHANLNYFERENVLILGEVNIPGAYPLLNDDESLKSLIDRAGGLSSKAFDNGISIFRDKIYFEDPPKDKILAKLQEQSTYSTPEEELEELEEKNNKIKLAWEGITVILMPGDSIVVKEKAGAVLVTGEVYNAGLVEFQKGKSIRYYLNSAGGINNYGNRDNVIVVYPNGITVPWRRLRSPKVIDGSTIVVYQKENLVPFNLTEFAGTAASLVSSLVTIMVLTNQLNK